MEHVVWYTRCPVPTASGIAWRRNLFDESLASIGYSIRNIADQAELDQHVHFSHRLGNLFREGGVSPPLWAYARGAHTRVVGVTFMFEHLGLYVRADDDAESVRDLAGRRAALPVWPALPFNFFRFAAQMAYAGALRCHDMSAADLRMVDVVEDTDPLLNHNPSTSAARVTQSNYYGQLQALLRGEVDVIFAKGPEAALLEKEGAGRIRLLFDVSRSPNRFDKLNNSTPRLITVDARTAHERPDVVVAYLRALVRAAQWARSHPDAARQCLAFECGIPEAELNRFLQPGYLDELLPLPVDQGIAEIEYVAGFLHEHGYLDAAVDVRSWLAGGLAEQALGLEAV